jgi:hypothetical protein
MRPTRFELANFGLKDRRYLFHLRPLRLGRVPKFAIGLYADSWFTLPDGKSGGGGSRGSHSRGKSRTAVERSPRKWLWNKEWEAADGGRTRDLKLGKLALYQLSYRRIGGGV